MLLFCFPTLLRAPTKHFLRAGPTAPTSVTLDLPKQPWPFEDMMKWLNTEIFVLTVSVGQLTGMGRVAGVGPGGWKATHKKKNNQPYVPSAGEALQWEVALLRDKPGGGTPQPNAHVNGGCRT